VNLSRVEADPGARPDEPLVRLGFGTPSTRGVAFSLRSRRLNHFVGLRLPTM
jgi:hypothetical protein